MAIMVKLSHDWADEFDVEGVQFWESEGDYTKWRDAIAAEITSGEQTSWGFGSNQEIEFEDADDFLRGLRETQITQEEFDTTLGIWSRSGTRPYHYGISVFEQNANPELVGHRFIQFGNNPI